MKDKKPHHSTHYIHRTSYSSQERMVGIFVLSAIVVLIFLLFSAIKSKNIFEEHFLIYGKLNSAEGLSTETIVQISGIEVGKVSDIDITDDNHIMLTMQIFNRYHKLLRTDSKIKVSSLNATIIGKSIIGITAGSHNKELLKPGTVLDIQESGSVEDVIVEATAILDVINNMVHEIATIVSAVDPKKISSTIDSLNNMTRSIEQYAERMNSDKGALGMIVHDEALQKNISDSAKNIKQATDQLSQLISALKQNADEVPIVLKSINSVVDETEETIEAAQRIWPISSAINKQNKTDNTVSPLPAND